MAHNNIDKDIEFNIEQIKTNFDFKTFNKETLSNIVPVYNINL